MKKLFPLFLLVLLCSLPSRAQVAGSIQLGGATNASVATISCSPLTMNFGNQVVNTTSAAQLSLCTAGGTALQTVTSLVISSGVYALSPSNTCTAGLVLGPGATCSIVLVFTPTSLTTFPATATLTVTGSVGSPQVVTITGTGVNSGGGGGPTAWTAPTDKSVHNYSGVMGATVNTGAPNWTCVSGCMPAENVISVDLDFLHSTSGGPCSSNGTCWSRCTGPTMTAAIRALDPSLLSNISYRDSAGSASNIWSADGTGFMAVTSQGTREVYINVNPATLACTLNQELAAGGTFSNTTITGGTGTIGMSKVNAKIGFGYTVANQTSLVQIDLSTGNTTTPGPVTQLFDTVGTGGFGGTNCNFPAGQVPSVFGGGWDTTPDNVALGHDNRFISYLARAGEAQNTASYVVVIDRPTGGCVWHNVKTGDMGGNSQWPGGAATCTGCGVTGGTGMHAVTISPDGNFAEEAVMGISATEPWIWQIGTTTLTLATALPNFGHRAFCGVNLIAGQSGNNARWGAILESAPTVFLNFGTRLGAPAPGGTNTVTDQHNYCGMESTTGVGTMYSGTFTNSINGVCIDPTYPGNNEIHMVATDTTATTWRFMHTKNNSCLPGTGQPTNFWFETSGSATPLAAANLGIYLFEKSTNWDGTLGVDNGTVDPRSDIIIGQIR